MKLKVERKILLNSLNTAIKVVATKTTDKVFMNFLLDYSDEILTIIASDGNTSIKTFITEGIECDEDNGFQVPAKQLFDIVNKVESEVITFDYDGQVCKIICGKSKFKLLTAVKENYPEIVTAIPDDSVKATFPLKDLQNLFNTTKHAVTTSGAKELYYGVNVSVKDNHLYFTTTDSFRMAQNSVETPSVANFSFTAPVSALNVLSGCVGDSCTIYYKDNFVVFEVDTLILTTRLYYGDFPSVDKLIPDSYKYQVTFNADEFLKAMERSKIILDPTQNNIIKLSLNGDVAELLTKSLSFGDSSEELDCSNDNAEPFEIAFNSEFVSQAIRALGDDKINFNFNENTRLFVISGKDTNNIQIVTPVRLN